MPVLNQEILINPELSHACDTWHFDMCYTVDSDEPVQPPFKANLSLEIPNDLNSVA